LLKTERISGWRSILGWILAVAYAAVFVAAYLDYLKHQHEWMADLGVNVLAIPYILVARVVTSDATFSVHGSEPWSLIPAFLFCSGLVYVCGWLLEALIRRGWISLRKKFKPQQPG